MNSTCNSPPKSHAPLPLHAHSLKILESPGISKRKFKGLESPWIWVVVLEYPGLGKKSSPLTAKNNHNEQFVILIASGPLFQKFLDLTQLFPLRKKLTVAKAKGSTILWQNVQKESYKCIAYDFPNWIELNWIWPGPCAVPVCMRHGPSLVFVRQGYKANSPFLSGSWPKRKEEEHKNWVFGALFQIRNFFEDLEAWQPPLDQHLNPPGVVGGREKAIYLHFQNNIQVAICHHTTS